MKTQQLSLLGCAPIKYVNLVGSDNLGILYRGRILGRISNQSYWFSPSDTNCQPTSWEELLQDNYGKELIGHMEGELLT